ncbi:hypothetical protein ACX27_14300 [Nostoc piscinale CENA21]|uniref:Uncharacterized protein n=2 Tax=Nostoc TaxID=1177 RepID=A0A0M4SRX8_9NOSO|nr:hypothetical protein ACX27_14300 [Nostoc piscinale CENA21]
MKDSRFIIISNLLLCALCVSVVRNINFTRYCFMSDQQKVIELIKRLPPDVSIHHIIQEIKFLAAIHEGVDEISSRKEYQLTQFNR